MSDYSIVPNAALTATADAIRTKSGSQVTIEFDHNMGFASAVNDIPSGSGPDLSNDTVTAATLLVGETAHDASGTAITGTLTGEDFCAGSLQITTVNPTTSIMVSRGLLEWKESTKKLTYPLKIFSAGGGVYTCMAPTGQNLIAFSYSSTNPLTFSDLSSGVYVLNNGDPIEINSSNMAYIVMVNVSASSIRSFTVTGA